MRALAVKELRELAWICGVALALLTWIVVRDASGSSDVLPGGGWARTAVYGYGAGGRTAPFADEGFLFGYGVVVSGLGIVVALRQTLGESFGGTWLFLLHRPMRRERILGTKAAVGWLLVWATAALPLIGYALWASLPGSFAGPFFWWATAAAAKLWALSPLVYAGAFLTGLRPARWLGTRLLPLVAGVVVFVALLQIPPAWLWAGLAILAAFGFWTAIRAAGIDRDYP